MQPYPSYKSSGISWIGEIPEHWRIERFKRIFKEKRKTTNLALPTGSISFGDVIFKDEEKITVATKASYQEVLTGEFLINPLNMNYDLKSLRIALSTIDVVVSSGYIVIKHTTECSLNYFRWLLRVYDTLYMKTLGAGVRQTINYNDLADTLLIFPPLAEQQQIADFLDSKTALIDKAIAIKQQQISLLNERKQVLIQNLVTGKIVWDGTSWAPPRTTKPSGIKWIGDIPQDWEVRKLKFIFELIQTGTTPPTAIEKYYNGEIDWYNPRDLDEEILTKSAKKVSEIAIRDKVIKKFPKDSILIVGIGTLGKTAYAGMECCFNQQITGFNTKKHSAKFYFYVFKSIAKYILNVANYTTLPILNNEFFKSLYLPLPDSGTQAKLIERLEEISKITDVAILNKQQEIQKLKEYKTSLINEVVTGKIKVS